MRNLLLSLVLAVAFTAASATLAFAQSHPQFVLGFRMLHDMIPEIVGQPVENEHFNPQNGDALQATTNGLLVWRKADNYTAFTDGFTTWVNGPDGLQSRPNGERFPWEPAAPPAPAVAGAPPPSPPLTPAPTGPRPSTTTPPVPQPGNWSGYAVTKFRRGQDHTSVAGSWVVPTPKLPPKLHFGASAIWIGIGGACQDSQCNNVDETLIQVGTEQDAYVDGNEYYAWYEMLPGSSKTITALSIRPGDRMRASIQMTKGDPGSVQTWQINLTNETTGKSWSQTVQYKSTLASADWIVEAPFAHSVVPLADFGTMTFSSTTANGANPRLSAADGIVMINPNGQNANVSAPSPNADGFNVCFGSGVNLTQCSAPPS